MIEKQNSEICNDADAREYSFKTEWRNYEELLIEDNIFQHKDKLEARKTLQQR